MAFPIETNELLSLLWRATWQSSVLALLVAAAIVMTRGCLAAKWRVVLWTLPLCRMLLLVVPASGISIFNGFSLLTVAKPVVPSELSKETVKPLYATSKIPLLTADSDKQGNPERFARRDAFEKRVIAAPITGANEENANRLSLAAVAIAIWLLVCFILTLRWGWATLALRRTLASCEPLDPDLWEQWKPSTISTSWLPALLPVRCVVTQQDLGPATCGFFRPTILLPMQLVSELTTAQLRSIVLHEYQHIRRFDVLLLTLSRCVKTIYWFNPVAYIVSKILRREMELAVDAATIRSLKVSDRQAYGYLLLQLAQRPVGSIGLAQMADRCSAIKARIHAISNPFHNSPTRSVLAIGLIGTLLAVGFTQEKVASSTPEKNEAGTIVQVPAERVNSISAAMEASLERLPELYESVCHSIVRIETPDNENVTGVIVSTNGHILVGGGGGKLAKVHLSDGRIVNATAAGWSNEWRLGVMKINEAGPWPAIELGSTKDIKAGEPCLVIGYSPRGDKCFDSTPTARFGFIDRNQPARWFTTTCFPGFWESAAVVGMNGHLLGVDTNAIGFQSYHTAVDVFDANRDNLFAGKNLDWVRYPPNPKSMYRLGAGDQPEMLDWRSVDGVLDTATPVEPMSDQELTDVKRIAKETTVRIVSKDRLDVLGKDGERWSGVIVSKDGYILTCGHTEQLPGERFTIYLSDGREAEALALGSNPISDIGLVKITTPGPWPFAEMIESSTLVPGDPLVVAGYPAINNITKKHWSTERMPQIDTSAVKHPSFLLWNGEFRTTGRTDWPYQGGMSGGGVFDRKGRYVGISQANDAPTCTELAMAQWDELKQIQSVDTATGLPHPMRRRFDAPSKSIAPSVVEVMVDSKPASFGIVVDAGGWILTKASVLNGKLSCRLPDQSIVVAEKRAESQEHDLALLKIGAGGLTVARFYDSEPPSIAQALCGVGSNQILKPGIVSIETREVPPEPRWKGAGTEDSEDGVLISSSDETNPITIGTKLEVGDIVVAVNGQLTPNLDALKQVLETSLSEYITGDLVSVTLRRKGVSVDVLTKLPPAIIPRPLTGMLKLDFISDELDTPRRSGFEAVFDTDIEPLKHEGGCPVIDVKGRIRGIAIVSRGRYETQRGPTSVLPSEIVIRAVKQLMADATSR